MKRIHFLSVLMPALMMVTMMSSCGNKNSEEKNENEYVTHLEDITSKIEKNREKWSVSDWEKVFQETLNVVYDFVKSDPDEDTYGQFNDAMGKWDDAIMETSSQNAMERIEEAYKNAREDYSPVKGHKLREGIHKLSSEYELKNDYIVNRIKMWHLKEDY